MAGLNTILRWLNHNCGWFNHNLNRLSHHFSWLNHDRRLLKSQFWFAKSPFFGLLRLFWPWHTPSWDEPCPRPCEAFLWSDATHLHLCERRSRWAIGGYPELRQESCIMVSSMCYSIVKHCFTCWYTFSWDDFKLYRCFRICFCLTLWCAFFCWSLPWLNFCVPAHWQRLGTIMSDAPKKARVQPTLPKPGRVERNGCLSVCSSCGNLCMGLSWWKDCPTGGRSCVSSSCGVNKGPPLPDVLAVLENLAGTDSPFDPCPPTRLLPRKLLQRSFYLT